MPFRAMRFLFVFGGHSVTTQDIRSWGNRLKVGGIYTQSILAQVINLKTDWNRTLMKLIRKSMSIKSFANRFLNRVLAIKHGLKFSISGAFSTNPVPASFGPLYMSQKQGAIFFKQFSHEFFVLIAGKTCKRK